MREAKPRRVGDRWQVRLTDEHGRRRKRLFDAHAYAVKARTAEQARVAEVKDGLRDPTPADRTLDQLADYCVKHRVPLKRSGQDDISILERHLRPARRAWRNTRRRQLIGSTTRVVWVSPDKVPWAVWGAEQRFFEVEWAGSLLYLRGR